jgi:hypothetical protein
VVSGVEDAADHPERSVHTHEDQVRSTRIEPELAGDAQTEAGAD